VLCCRGRYDSSWVRVFIDIPIANDAEALLQDRFLVLCGVGWFESLRILWTMLTNFSFKKPSMGLMLCTRRALSVDIPMTFRKRRCCACISFFALVDADEQGRAVDASIDC
jgi:hypothetical protein